MKTIVLCLSAIVIMAAGCSKSSTTASGRDAFVGNYHMHDSIIMITGSSGGVNTYDTTSSDYTMQVLALSGTSDKIVFNNAAGYSSSDTGTVSGTFATFLNGQAVSDATLSGNTITLSGYVYGGNTVYSKFTGTKF